MERAKIGSIQDCQQTEQSLEWRVVEARERSMDWVQSVASGVFDHSIRLDFLETYLNKDDQSMFLAQATGGQIIGQVRAAVLFQPDSPSHLYVDNLGVSPKFQHKGVGTALMKAIVQWGQTNHGCTEVWVATEIDNSGAVSFYTKIGWKRTDVAMFDAVL